MWAISGGCWSQRIARMNRLLAYLSVINERVLTE